MDQHPSFYATSPAVQAVASWLYDRLPELDPVVQRRIVQLTAGVFEAQSVLLEAIAASSAFRAPVDASNFTQVQRILKDLRLTLETVYVPVMRTLLAELALTTAYVTIDETSHGPDFGMFQVGVATDGIVLPVGWVLYEPDAPWAEDARALLTTVATLLPGGCRVLVLADRLHTGEPFLDCLTELGWDYVMRAKEDIFIETPTGWKPFYVRTLPHNTGKFFADVRVWKSRKWRTNVSIYKHVRPGFRPVTWVVLSSLPPSKQRFVEYAVRWWQECGFRDLKSDLFQWERGRVRIFERVDVLLMAMGLATWALWALGRQHEARPRAHGAEKPPAPRRKALVKQGVAVLKRLVKHGLPVSIGPLPALRVLDYFTAFSIA